MRKGEKAHSSTGNKTRRSKDASRTKKSRGRTSGNTLPAFAIIGGSQAYRFLAKNSQMKRIGVKETPFGESQAIFLSDRPEGSFLFMSRHGEKGYHIAASFVNYRANIYALKDLGVRQIVSWSGPGAISLEYKIGQFVTVDDIIDETRRRPNTFFEHKGLGFIRQNPVFCPYLSGLLQKTLTRLKLDFSPAGTYVCTEGPRLETPAEIRKFSLNGAHLVGMTLVPEVFLAKELEMCYAALCYVTNYAEGIKDKTFQPGMLFEGLADEEEHRLVEKSVVAFPTIIESMANLAAEENAAAKASECNCAQLMQRYRDRGDIGDDWHEWILP